MGGASSTAARTPVSSSYMETKAEVLVLVLGRPYSGHFSYCSLKILCYITGLRKHLQSLEDNTSVSGEKNISCASKSLLYEASTVSWINMVVGFKVQYTVNLCVPYSGPNDKHGGVFAVFNGL